MSAQAIKRDADTMVDAVSAEDIRVLDNRSVLGAIQRMPGIALERFADTSDPGHFSVEASGIIIRGMSQSRSEFNGRDSFTANSGRGLSYQDAPWSLSRDGATTLRVRHQHEQRLPVTPRERNEALQGPPCRKYY